MGRMGAGYPADAAAADATLSAERVGAEEAPRQLWTHTSEPMGMRLEFHT
jgi:hypothetical protein